jgi:hypothetical protein
MAYHKGRGIMFGGVHDVELTEEGIDSEFFDTLFAWNTDRNRFFPLSLRRPRAPGKKQQANQNARAKNRGKADEEELLANLKALEAKVGIRNEDEAEEMQSTPQPEEPEEPAKPSIVRFEMPHRRFNAQLAVQDDTLFIFGGTFEKGDREFTFDDMYSIDLVKLDGVKEIFYREPENWNLLNEAEDSDEDMDDEDDDEMDEDEDEGDAEAMSLDAASPAPTDTTVPSVTKDMEQLEVEEPEEQNVNDSRPLPRPFESLREFFSRTSEDWQNIMMDIAKERENASEKTIKELRKAAFSVAEERWWDSREEIMALEDEQEAAGIGEVVSMSDRTENMGGAGRRR